MMPRIEVPEYNIRSIRAKERNPRLGRSPYISQVNRNYARIDGKFIPVGWYVIWSDDQKNVYLDEEIPDDMEAIRNYNR